MKKRFRKIACALLCVSVLLALAAGCSNTSSSGDGGSAEGGGEYANWPEKTIQIVVPYNTGGTPDILMRSYARYSDFDIVVSNMPGSSGMVGTNQVLHSNPDGYTLLAMMPETMLTLYYGGDSGVHPNELEWVGCLAATYMALAVHPDSQFETWDDIVAYCKENPGEFTVTSSGSKSVGETLMHILNNFYDIEMTWVPQASTADARTAVMGKHCDAILGNTDDVATNIQGGDLRGIFVAMDEPHPIIPDVPLLKDITGDESMVYGTSRGIQAPPGTPEEIMDMIYADMAKVFELEDFQNDLDAVGLIPKLMDRQAYTQLYEELDPVFKEIWDQFK